MKSRARVRGDTGILESQEQGDGRLCGHEQIRRQTKVDVYRARAEQLESIGACIQTDWGGAIDAQPARRVVLLACSYARITNALDIGVRPRPIGGHKRTSRRDQIGW